MLLIIYFKTLLVKQVLKLEVRLSSVTYSTCSCTWTDGLTIYPSWQTNFTKEEYYFLKLSIHTDTVVDVVVGLVVCYGQVMAKTV